MYSRSATFIAVVCLVSLFIAPAAFGAAVNVPISGEIERIAVKFPNDPWSPGEMVIGGQVVIIPRNLLIDLPANRLTLQQIFAQAPAACLTAGESGLAKADTCNTSGAGGFATISANRVATGNVIAGDVFIEKGRELVTGTVTYIDHTMGYFRLNGNLNSRTTGVMVRLNDPTSRHTIQKGPGCGSPVFANCSPDPRFTLDPDNYTNVFATGYPVCIPSTVARPFPGLPAAQGIAALPAGTAQALTDGTGDLLCPGSNRQSVVNEVANDSRRFAPIKVGDHVKAEGNFETVNGVRFLSAHTTMVSKALMTKDLADQPDYFFLDEVEIDTVAYQNQRARSLFIGFASLAPAGGADILIWSIHRGTDNAVVELPLASVKGCDQVGGPGACGAQGLGGGAGNNIFKIRHDVDFIAAANTKPELNPCSIINAEPRFGSASCNPASLSDQFSVLSPTPHEIMARSGHKLANPGLSTIDIRGNTATNGQYLFPLGVNLGGIGFPEMVEIDLNALNTPFSFSGITWLMDRRLSPGGCVGACESTPQPLRPFPFEEIDPRTQAAVPAPGRILSFAPFGGGDVLAWPPTSPGAIAIGITPPLTFTCGGAPTSALVTGRVIKTGGGPLVGVRLTLADAATGTPVTSVLTDYLGNYIFAGVANGDYMLTPSKGLFTFTPTSSTVAVTGPGFIAGGDFAAQ